MKQRRIIYSDSEIAFLRKHQGMARQELHAKFVAEFERPDVTYFNIKDVCKRNRWTCLSKRVYPAGSERITKDGYILIATDDLEYYLRTRRVRYVFKHRLLWEQRNGRIPNGMILKCKGDKKNCDPSNWELIDSALIPRLNGFNRGLSYDEAPAELKPTIMAVAKLEHSVHRSRDRDPKMTMPLGADG